MEGEVPKVQASNSTKKVVGGRTLTDTLRRIVNTCINAMLITIRNYLLFYYHTAITLVMVQQCSIYRYIFMSLFILIYII